MLFVERFQNLFSLVVIFGETHELVHIILAEAAEKRVKLTKLKSFDLFLVKVIFSFVEITKNQQVQRCL